MDERLRQALNRMDVNGDGKVTVEDAVEAFNHHMQDAAFKSNAIRVACFVVGVLVGAIAF